MAEADHVTLSELIGHVTGELNKARRASDAGTDKKVLVLEECVLELRYDVTKTADGGIDLKVVNASGTRERAMGNSISVTFKAFGTGQVFVADAVRPTDDAVSYGRRPETSK